MKNIMKLLVLVFLSSICIADTGIMRELKKGPSVDEYWQKEKQKRELSTKKAPKDHKVGKSTKKISKKGSLKRSSNSVLKVSMLNDAQLMNIEIPADTNLAENTFWSEDVHLNGKVYVDGVMLVIKPGVIVTNSANGGIVVRDGGALIANGTPNAPIVFISDEQYSPNDYEFAIKFDPNSCQASIVSNCVIMFANKGIWNLDNHLDNAFSDNHIEFCEDGIVQEGPMLTDVQNNAFVDCYDDGVEIFLENANGNASNKARVVLENNLVIGSSFSGWGQNCGFTIHGTTLQENAGVVLMANNLIVNSYYSAVNQVDGWMALADRYCHGYYENAAIENEGNPYEDVLPQILTSDPFVNGYWQAPFFLNQGCSLINTGAMDIETAPYLISKSTSIEGAPDEGMVDIGYHYQNWEYVNAGSTTLSADFDNSHTVDSNDLVNFLDYWLYDYNREYRIWQWDLDDSNMIDVGDLAILASYWLNPATMKDFADFASYWMCPVDLKFQDPRYDLNSDGFVNMVDWTIFSSQWLAVSGPVPGNMTPTFNSDPNSLSGYENVYIQLPANVQRVFLFVDGSLYSEFGDIEDSPALKLDTSKFFNGNHSVKIVCTSEDKIICSTTTNVNFNNDLNMRVKSQGFSPGKDYYFYAFGSGQYSATIKDIIVAEDDPNTIYSATFNNGLTLRVPASSFTEEYGAATAQVVKTAEPQINLMSTFTTAASTPSVGEMVEWVIARKFDKADFGPDSNIGIVVSIGSEDLRGPKEKCWRGVIKAAVKKRIWPVFLDYEACTWDNLSYCLRLNKVKMWYHLSHGNDKLVFQPQRQVIALNGPKLFSYLKKDYGDNVPPNYEELSSWYENNPSMAELGFQNTSKMTWVQINACDSAKTTQFPTMLGILPITDPTYIGDSVFIGWHDPAFVNDMVEHYAEFEKKYWEYLGNGRMLKTALEDALVGIRGSIEIYENFRCYGVIDLQYAYFRYPDIN